MLFTHQVRAGFHHGDPEGIVFFGNAYTFAHEAFEKFVEHLGFQWKEWFTGPDWGTPIRHSECEHLAMILPSVTYDVSVELETIGDSSFTGLYTIQKDGKVHARVKITQVFFGRKDRKKISIPTEVRNRLEAYKAKSVGPA